MVRLTTLTLLIFCIFVQLSQIDCQKAPKKKNKGCTFNGQIVKSGKDIGDILSPEEKKVYYGLCVELVCKKNKKKPKGRKNGGKGKKPKFVLEAKEIEKCSASQCEECPTICTEEFAPVCGTDLETYDNKCKLALANCQNPDVDIQVAYEGPCVLCGGKKCLPPPPTVCPDVCTADYTPVCGTDGKTYSNACMLGITSCKNPDDNIQFAYEGKCNGTDGPKQNEGNEGPCPDPSTVVCSAEWTCTVEKYIDTKTGCTKCRCDTDDPKYDEFCAPLSVICPMDCGVIKYVDKKSGCQACKCDAGDGDNPFAPKPTITVDLPDTSDRSKSWPSLNGCNTCTCMNGIAACTEMACIEPPLQESESHWICENGCSKEMVEVCGSDGVTYQNSCKLDQARICEGLNVTLKHPGPCAQAGESRKMKCKACNKGGMRKWQPVCGSDCKTYSNACMLEFHNCENEMNVQKVMEGSCEGKGKSPAEKRMFKKPSAKKAVKKTSANKGMLKRSKRAIRKKILELPTQRKNKGKKGKCIYNGKKIRKNKVVDLGIKCTQLLCTMDGGEMKLKMQSIPDCPCSNV